MLCKRAHGRNHTCGWTAIRLGGAAASTASHQTHVHTIHPTSLEFELHSVERKYRIPGLAERGTEATMLWQRMIHLKNCEDFTRIRPKLSTTLI